jgi:hypothetical protein
LPVVEDERRRRMARFKEVAVDLSPLLRMKLKVERWEA